MSTITAQLGVADESTSAPTISSTSYAAGPPETMTVTFDSDPGLTAHIDWLELSGFTPSGYDAVWPVIAVDGNDATLLVDGDLGAPSVDGTATALQPGTAATVTRFYKPSNVGLARDDYPRLMSEGIFAGKRTRTKSQVIPVKGGISGEIAFDVLSKGFGFWFGKIMGGTVDTTDEGGSPTAYSHVWQLGALEGRTFTAQVNKPFRTGAARPMTYLGCKIASATLAIERNGLLTLTVDVIGIDEDDTIALETVSFSSAEEPVAFCGATLDLDGTAVPAHSWSVTVNNSLEEDTARLRGDCTQMEHLTEGLVEVEFAATVDWRDYTFRDKYASLVAADVLGDLTLTAQWPAVISGSNYPSVEVNLPAAHFDGGDPTIGGIELLTQEIEGVALDPEDGTNTAMKLTYMTADATP